MNKLRHQILIGILAFLDQKKLKNKIYLYLKNSSVQHCNTKLCTL
ncbi:hypothetical protein SAMN05421766_1104 [Zobellia uliginosa]|uniref:Uncharacterized protein n=1 Tax=Zobellia uliginosa TaxID=143224 RepID=A0ABY1L5P6_9FLAO|nr:hypothetical protein SAMN05421766_1104 [Zobellia uliginosa]